MSEQKNVLGDYFSSVAEDRSSIMQETSSVEGIRLNSPGEYLMAVNVNAYKGKNDWVLSPLIMKKASGNIQLALSLSTQDSCSGVTPNGHTVSVAKGSSTTVYITLAPPPQADRASFEKIFKIMKPRIAALTGVEDVKFDQAWFHDYLEVDFVEKDGKMIATKDHKMTKQVMVKFDRDIYVPTSGKPQYNLKISKIRTAVDGDKSVTHPDGLEDGDKAAIVGETHTGYGSNEGSLAMMESTGFSDSSMGQSEEVLF